MYILSIQLPSNSRAEVILICMYCPFIQMASSLLPASRRRIGIHIILRLDPLDTQLYQIREGNQGVLEFPNKEVIKYKRKNVLVKLIYSYTISTNKVASKLQNTLIAPSIMYLGIQAYMYCPSIKMTRILLPASRRRIGIHIILRGILAIIP